MKLVLVLLALLVVRTWATWATCPPGVPLVRHAQAAVGRSVLDLFAVADRIVVGVLVLVVLLWATWSWVEPQIAAAVASGASSAREAVTPDVHLNLPEWIKGVTR